MSPNRSSDWAAGTPEAIFAPVLDATTIRFAQRPSASRSSTASIDRLAERPWLFSEHRSPIIPHSWVTEEQWHVSASNLTKKTRERMQFSQDDLATPGYVLSKYPNVDLVALAEQSVAKRASIGSWLKCHLAEVYESILSQTELLTLGEVPIRVSTFKRLLQHGCQPELPLADVLQLRRSDLFTQRSDAVALVDLEMMIENWLPYRDADSQWQQMRQARRLRDVAGPLASRLAAGGPKTSPTQTEILRRRGWGLPKATLEQLGDERGVTRERVRQLFIPIEKRLGERRWPLSPRIDAVIKQLITPSDLDDEDGDLLEEIGSDWTVSGVVNLLEALGREEIAARVKGASAARARGLPKELQSTIREHRSMLGFLDLTVLATDPIIKASGHDPVRLVKKVYSRVVVEEDFALATSDPSSTAERIAAQQFFVSPAIQPSEFREGFVRVAKKRKQPTPPPVDRLISLLSAVGAVTSAGSTVTGPPGELEEGTLHRWLADRLETATGGVLHVDSLVRAAIRDQKNISSLTNYVTYEPFVRRIGGTGLVRLVGRTVSETDQELASRVAEAQRRPTKIIASPHASGLAIDLTAGTALFTSGVLPIPTELRAVWPKPGPTPRCICDHNFESRFTIKNGSIIGWQPLLSHLVLHHGLDEGGQIRMVVDGRDLSIEEISAS